MEHIYLDHAATTPVSEQVVAAMMPIYQEVFGNPSSIHSFGRDARRITDEARTVMAKSIHANDREIILTSGGTEADNLALIGTAIANQHKGKHIITTKQEHHATLRAAEYLQANGFEVTFLPVDTSGQVSVEDLQNALRSDTIMVSIMMVNNETGAIQPIKEIGESLKDHQAYFHTDAVQAFGLMDINVHELGVDMLSVSAHKINGPKGIGFLYMAKGTMFQPIQLGGEQERKRRAGTENVASIVGFQQAIELVTKKKQDHVHTYQTFKTAFLDILTNKAISFQVNGNPSKTSPAILNISFTGMNVETLLMNLDLDGVAASGGSACTAGSIEPSHVLCAMYGPEDERTKNAVRFSFGSCNTMENVKMAANRVVKIIRRLSA